MGNLVFQATLGGQVNLVGPNTASTYNINVPAIAGTMVTTGDTGSVSSTMLASSLSLTTPNINVATGTSLKVTSGFYSTSSSSFTYTDGIVMDYTTGLGRISVGTSDGLAFYNAGVATTELMRLDSSGKLGIGTSSPSAKLDVAGANALIKSTASSGYAGFYANAATGNQAYNFFAVNGTEVARIGSDSTNTLFFSTGSSGTGRMYIDSSGNLLVGTTNSSNPTSGFVVNPNSSTQVEVAHASGTSSGNGYMFFMYNAGIIGSITQNGTTGVLFNITSDYRLKNDPQPLTGAKEFVMALQPKTWDWWDGSGKGAGFIAHEFMEVAKYSGHGEKDAVDENGNPVYQTIQPSSSEVMANLVSLLQEQQAIIQQLQADVTALKAPQ